MMLDPNTLSADGTVAVSGLQVSADGKLLAYSFRASGSDWQEWKVRDVETGKDLADHLKWVKFSGASWTRDSKGFFYSRYDEPKGRHAEGDQLLSEGLLPQTRHAADRKMCWFTNVRIRKTGCLAVTSLKTAITSSSRSSGHGRRRTASTTKI